jgi:hypothetical protein
MGATSSVVVCGLMCSIIKCFFCLVAYFTENPHDNHWQLCAILRYRFCFKKDVKENWATMYHSNKESYQTKSDVTKLILAIIYEVRKERLMWRPHPFISLSVGQRFYVTDKFICRFFCEIFCKSTLTQTFRAKWVNLGASVLLWPYFLHSFSGLDTVRYRNVQKNLSEWMWV